MHFRGDKFIEELEGLKSLDIAITKFNDDKNIHNGLDIMSLILRILL